jgi:hypothetical protein
MTMIPKMMTKMQNFVLTEKMHAETVATTAANFVTNGQTTAAENAGLNPNRVAKLATRGAA